MEGQEYCESFDALFICSGLVNERRSLLVTGSDVKVTVEYEHIRDRAVVVLGGGESAVDVANTLAQPELNNRVFLSLRSGIRLSPRYHPIRGVPSDFLRNRLLMSLSEELRNSIGDRFVSFRIRYRNLLERMYPAKCQTEEDVGIRGRRSYWELKLQQRAKGDLFNVFHTKSDGFMDQVARGRIQIVGPSVDERYTTFFDFDRMKRLDINPTVVVPQIGYRSKLDSLIRGFDFSRCVRGCVSTQYSNLFLIGFARPVIGNIPTISEMQARFCSGVLSGKWSPLSDIQGECCEDKPSLADRYPEIKTADVFPVDQFPYCDSLAKTMGVYPSFGKVSLRAWLKLMLTPVSTTHYTDEFFDDSRLLRAEIFMPFSLILLLISIKAFGEICSIFISGLNRFRE